jgi:hypothetical protein
MATLRFSEAESKLQGESTKARSWPTDNPMFFELFCPVGEAGDIAHASAMAKHRRKSFGLIVSPTLAVFQNW